MHREFSEWYRAAGMEPTNALPKRWLALESYSTDADTVASLARLFYGLGEPEANFRESFQSAFQTADPTFKMTGNENELSVLAGATLIDVIEGGSADLADLAALSLVCAAGANLRPPPVVKRIPELAGTYLNERALSRSTFGDEDEIEEDDLLLGPFLRAATPLPEIAKPLRYLQRQLALVREESNMLWWLFSQFSKDAQQPWSKLPFASVPLIAGKELSDLTVVIPGPTAARAFLGRVLQCAKLKPPALVSVTDAINTASIEWRTALSTNGCPVKIESLMPFTLGIKFSLSAPTDNQWHPAFARGTLIQPQSKIEPSILAYQSFLEAMLCRSWKQTN